MKRQIPLILAVILFAVVLVGWYCSENYSGRIPDDASTVGLVIIYPGRFLEVILSGNLHAGFADWRGPPIEVCASYLVWVSPLIALACLLRRRG